MYTKSVHVSKGRDLYTKKKSKKCKFWLLNCKIYDLSSERLTFCVTLRLILAALMGKKTYKYRLNYNIIIKIPKRDKARNGTRDPEGRILKAKKGGPGPQIWKDGAGRRHFNIRFSVFPINHL